MYWPWRGSIGWAYPDSHNLKLSNRPVRTRMPGGVAGVQSLWAAPYADCAGRLISAADQICRDRRRAWKREKTFQRQKLAVAPA